MEKNKTVKYFKYAIGEIVLVVIGILIALYFSALQQNSNIQVEIERKLNEIHLEVQADKEQLKSVIFAQEKGVDAIDQCIRMMSANSMDLDSLAIYMGKLSTGYNGTFFPHNGAYKSLISSGKFDVINDSQLTIELSNLYEHSYSRLSQNGSFLDLRLEFFLEESYPYFIHSKSSFSTSNIPKESLYSLLHYFKRAKEVYLSRAYWVLENINKTLNEFKV